MLAATRAAPLPRGGAALRRRAGAAPRRHADGCPRLRPSTWVTARNNSIFTTSRTRYVTSAGHVTSPGVYYEGPAAYEGDLVWAIRRVKGQPDEWCPARVLRVIQDEYHIEYDKARLRGDDAPRATVGPLLIRQEPPSDTPEKVTAETDVWMGRGWMGFSNIAKIIAFCIVLETIVTIGKITDKEALYEIRQYVFFVIAVFLFFRWPISIMIGGGSRS